MTRRWGPLLLLVLGAVGSWWLLAVPATGLAATLLALNVVGDGMRREA